MSFSGDIAEIGLPYPVSIALEFDPLAALMTLLASGTVYQGMLWSLVILIPTIFLGRFFCGWVCPLGSLNHGLSEIRSERRSFRGKGKIETNRYRPYQRIKYYVFFFCLGAALLGSLQAGLLDPLPLLARSLGHSGPADSARRGGRCRSLGRLDRNPSARLAGAVRL